MLQLIRRHPDRVDGYRDYCRELYQSDIRWFRPTDPETIDGAWFARTAGWYAAKEQGLAPGLPKGVHLWAVDGDRFIGEFQLRTELTEDVLTGMGSVGYAVRVSKQGRGYGTEILRQGLGVAAQCGLEKALLNISDQNAVSAHICEKLVGKLADRVYVCNRDEGWHWMRRYWITL